MEYDDDVVVEAKVEENEEAEFDFEDLPIEPLLTTIEEEVIEVSSSE